jgi:hypothetical protein
MNNQDKLLNDKFFKQVIKFTHNHGYYVYPAVNEVFQVVDEKLYGTKKGIDYIKNITTDTIHESLVVK